MPSSRLTAFAGCLVLALMGAAYATFNVVAAVVASHAHLSSTAVTLVANAGILGSWLHVTNGPFVERYGARTSVAVGMALWAGGFLAMAFAMTPDGAWLATPGSLALLNFVGMQGASFATMAALATVPALFNGVDRPSMLGALGATFALGQAFISTLYTVVLRNFSLAGHFAAMTAVGLFVMWWGAAALGAGRHQRYGPSPEPQHSRSSGASGASGGQHAAGGVVVSGSGTAGDSAAPLWGRHQRAKAAAAGRAAAAAASAASVPPSSLNGAAAAVAPLSSAEAKRREFFYAIIGAVSLLFFGSTTMQVGGADDARGVAGVVLVVASAAFLSANRLASWLTVAPVETIGPLIVVAGKGGAVGTPQAVGGIGGGGVGGSTPIGPPLVNGGAEPAPARGAGGGAGVESSAPPAPPGSPLVPQQAGLPIALSAARKETPSSSAGEVYGDSMPGAGLLLDGTDGGAAPLSAANGGGGDVVFYPEPAGTTIGQTLRSPDFWLLFVAYFCCAGLASAVNSVTSILVASLLDTRPGAAFPSVPLDVAVDTGTVYACGALARCWGALAFGSGAGWLQRRLRLSRLGLCLLFHCASVAIFALLAARLSLGSVRVLLPAVNFVWGLLYSSSQVVAVDLFGAHHFGALWGALSSSPCVSTFAFALLIAGRNADAERARSHYTAAGYAVCLGPGCFDRTLMTFAALAAAGAGCMAVIVVRRRRPGGVEGGQLKGVV